jgi:hypothetical protein
MEVVGLGLIALGALLIYTWFGTWRMMIREGTWAEQGGAGAHIWLAIHTGILFGRVPLLVEKRPDASSGRGSFE